MPQTFPWKFSTARLIPQGWGNPTFCCTSLEGDPERRGRRARPGALRAALQDSQRLHPLPTSEFSPRQITGSFQHQHFQPPTSFKAYLAQSCESSADFLPYVSQFSGAPSKRYPSDRLCQLFQRTAWPKLSLRV
jgi:hypothetical protein